MKAAVIFSSGAIALIALLVYYLLGGFNPVAFTLEIDDITIYGRLIESEYEDPQLEEQFLAAKKLTKDNGQNKLVVVDYFLDSKDSVKQFIGVASKEMLDLPSLVLTEVTFIKGVITAHPYVRPHPLKVRELATDFAFENSLDLDAFSIEFYSPSEEINVWFPGKAL